MTLKATDSFRVTKQQIRTPNASFAGLSKYFNPISFTPIGKPDPTDACYRFHITWSASLAWNSCVQHFQTDWFYLIGINDWNFNSHTFVRCKGNSLRVGLESKFFRPYSLKFLTIWKLDKSQLQTCKSFVLLTNRVSNRAQTLIRIELILLRRPFCQATKASSCQCKSFYVSKFDRASRNLTH